MSLKSSITTISKSGDLSNIFWINLQIEPRLRLTKEKKKHTRMMTLSFKYYRIWSNAILYSLTDRENQNWTLLFLWFEEIMRAHSNLRISHFWKKSILEIIKTMIRWIYKNSDTNSNRISSKICIVGKNLKITLSNQSTISHEEKYIEYIFLT